MKSTTYLVIANAAGSVFRASQIPLNLVPFESVTESLLSEIGDQGIITLHSLGRRSHLICSNFDCERKTHTMIYAQEETVNGFNGIRLVSDAHNDVLADEEMRIYCGRNNLHYIEEWPRAERSDKFGRRYIGLAYRP